MKWYKKRTDLTSLWEKDGDLIRMQIFFQTLNQNSEENERIKKSVKEKALEKMANNDDWNSFPLIGRENLVQRIRSRMGRVNGIGRWRLGLSLAAIVFLIIVSQGTLNTPWHLFPHMGSTTQSVGPAPKANDSLSAMAGGQTNGVAQNYGFTTNEGLEPNNVSMNSMDDSAVKSAAKAILPVPPVPTEAPPSDAGIARKITHDLTLTLQVSAINDTVTQISLKVQQLGGYVVESQQNDVESQSSAHLTVKIPANKLEGLHDSLSTWGKVLDQRMVANDITNQYYDAQLRLQTFQAEEKRYLEILNQAKTVDDVLKVENSLGNVRQEIEQIKGQLKLWNNQVDYSTVNVQLVTFQSPSVAVKNPWQPMAWSKTWKATQDAVLKTISSTWNILNYLVIGIGYALPYLLIGIICWGVYRGWKKIKL